MITFPTEETRELLHIGSNTLRFEPPNTCLVSYVGVLDADHVRGMNAALENVARNHGPIVLLVDLSQTGRVAEDARRLGVSGMIALNPTATVVFGANRHLGILVSMLIKAASLLKMSLDGPVRFFATEGDARAWISQSLPTR